MGYLENQELVNFYPDRQPWYVDRGEPAATLLPYGRVSAPLKRTFEDPTFKSDSQPALDGGHQSIGATPPG